MAVDTFAQGANGRRILTVENLSVSFGSKSAPIMAVRKQDFHVDRGEILAIVGESGSGKSVTSLTVMGLQRYNGGRISSGSLTFHRPDQSRVDLAALSEEAYRKVRGADIAMIFQEPMTSLNPVLSIGQQLCEAILLHRNCTQAEALTQAVHVLDQVRIPNASGLVNRYPHELSGGMRQRVMIAMALVCRPQLLIADEPTTALDVTIQAQILQLIKELQKELDMGVIFITHDMGVVAEVADRVMVMRHGLCLESGSVTDVFANPQHDYTKALMAAAPRLGAMTGTDAPAHFDLLNPDGDTTAAQAPVPTMLPVADDAADDSCTPAPRPVILRAEGLVTRFDLRGGLLGRVRQRVHAVENVSFDIHAGETLALVGESGSGKTTTGRSLLGLAPAQSGRISFEGKTLRAGNKADLQALRRHVQFIFQDPLASLNPRMRIGDAIKEPMLINGVASGAAADRRVGELLERVGLSPAMATRWPHEFSGGQRQRICIARAISVKPKIIIADEAVSALDVSIQAQVVNLLIDLQREMGMSILFISHDMAVVERISHRVAVMYMGQILEIGPRRAIFENPSHPYTRKLMAAVPVADPTKRQQRSLAVGELPSPIKPLNYVVPALEMREISKSHFVSISQFPQ